MLLKNMLLKKMLFENMLLKNMLLKNIFFKNMKICFYQNYLLFLDWPYLRQIDKKETLICWTLKQCLLLLIPDSAHPYHRLRRRRLRLRLRLRLRSAVTSVT